MFDTTDEIKFVPTLLDDVEKRRTIDLDAIDDSIFGNYGGPVTKLSSIRRRVLAAGGASALLIVGFLFAADFGRYAKTEGPDVSVAAKSEQPQVTLPAALPPTDVPAAKKMSLKTVEKQPPVEEKAEEKESKPAATKPQPERPVEPRTATAKQPATKSDSGKPKSVAAVKVASEKKPTLAASKASGATRPRIVAEQ